MINIVFFAQIRELLGVSHTELAYENISTVADVKRQLADKFSNWNLVTQEQACLCAVNQTLVDTTHYVHDGDEIAFFPPVTGG